MVLLCCTGHRLHILAPFLNENIYFENINFFSNKFCYGLNVCASSKFIYWSSSPHCDCFGGWGLSEVFILNKVRRMEPNPWWDLCPSKKRKRSELSQYWMWAQREKVTIYKAGKLNHTDTWSWISQLLELWQINVCGLSHLIYILLWQPKLTKTNLCIILFEKHADIEERSQQESLYLMYFQCRYGYLHHIITFLSFKLCIFG